MLTLNKKVQSLWGCSSVGRAPALQAGGRQFESDQLHHKYLLHACMCPVEKDGKFNKIKTIKGV